MLLLLRRCFALRGFRGCLAASVAVFAGAKRRFPVAVYPMKMSGSAAEGWKEVPMRRDLPCVTDEWWYPAVMCRNVE